MKLGLIYRSSLEKKEDGYYIKDVFGKYLEKIAPLFSQIDLCASVYPERALKKSFSHYHLKISNIEVLDFGRPRNEFSILSKLMYYTRLVKLFYTQVRKWDILYIFLPGYTGVIASVISRMLGKPYFVYTGIDWKDSSTYAWRWPGMKKKVLFPIYRFFNGYFEKMVIKHSAFTLVHGDALQKKYEKLGAKVVQTIPLISLSNRDVSIRKNLIEGNRLKCLFVGGLLPRKGLIYLIQALPILKNKGYNVTLNLVGAADEKYEKVLRELVKTLKLNNDVIFTGYVPNGPRLFEIYRNSDVFILPTLSEGFPRVLYEAMSQSLPIVTTNVGGIPGLMKHEVNALLVPPKDPKAIADAIERLTSDKTLRDRLITNGIKIVSQILKKDPAEQLQSLLFNYVTAYKERRRKKPK